MIEFNHTSISKFALHRISNEEENCFVNDTIYEDIEEEDEETLKRIFLKPFQTITTTYAFKHEVDIELNALLKLSKSIYEKDNFLNESKSIYQHLKAVSKHPNIKDGDLFIVKFDNLILDNTSYEALGIYKIENKENFIETNTYTIGGIDVRFRKGIGNKRLDKASLIIFTKDTYTVLIIDNNSTETDYWQNEFLKVDLRNDHINNTTQFLTLTKNFVTKQLSTDFVVTKADQIDLLNRSVDYFKSHENFEKEEFENEVFQDEAIIKSFRSFDSTYQLKNELDIADDFSISPQAVKKQVRVFKSVLKLDRNFAIYIHGNRNLIEQGVEKDGRKFYKIYFEEES